ncbi:MAG: hypothetical protein ACOC31_06760, partial [Bacteroidota bacterium]
MHHKKIIDHVWNNSYIFCVVFDKKGTILKANNHALKICGTNPVNKNVSEIFMNFGHPEMLDFSPTKTQEKRLINIATRENLPVSLYFNFYHLGDEILAIGEVDNAEIEVMRSTLIDTNN